MTNNKMWYIYLVRCSDGTLYCGISKDVGKRVVAHNDGKGAKYTRSRGPVTLVYVEESEDKSSALKREIAIKRMPRKRKLALASEWGKQ